MFDRSRSTEQVLAAARKDLEDQLDVIRSQIARLEAEERTVAEMLSALEREGVSEAAELSQLLTEGAKSRKDLAAALKVSPARVQQLLNELGSSVSSQPDPNEPRAKLWSLNGHENHSSDGGFATADRRGGAGGER